MFLVEKASRKIADTIASMLELDDERRAVLAYGAFNLLHTSLSTLLLILFGLLTGAIMEILLVALPAALLRRHSGGAHATSPNRCAVLSVLVFGGLSLSVKFVPFGGFQSVLFYQLITLLIVLFLFIQYCPVDTPNKRIVRQDMRDRLRKSSFQWIVLMTGLTVLFWLHYMRFETMGSLRAVVCICTGLLWQGFSISPIGRSAMGAMDMCMERIKI